MLVVICTATILKFCTILALNLRFVTMEHVSRGRMHSTCVFSHFLLPHLHVVFIHAPWVQTSGGPRMHGSSVTPSEFKVRVICLWLSKRGEGSAGSPKWTHFCSNQNLLWRQKASNGVLRDINHQGTLPYLFLFMLLPCVHQLLMLKVMMWKERETECGAQSLFISILPDSSLIQR